MRGCKEGARLEGRCKAGRKVQGWMEGARLEGRCKARRRVQGWKEGAKQEGRCKAVRKVQGRGCWVDGLRLEERSKVGRMVDGWWMEGIIPDGRLGGEDGGILMVRRLVREPLTVGKPCRQQPSASLLLSLRSW